LGELYGATGLRIARETAYGALRRSLRYVKEFPAPAYPLSLYAGHLGLLHVAVRLAELDPEESSMEEECGELLKRAWREWRSPHPYDVIGGNAGAILALLGISERFRTGECQELAVQLGEELCETAAWAGEICSWQATGGFAKLPPMTGFSHGASGIAISLLRLYQLTGDPRFLRTARGSFAFEDALYSSVEKNWVDTRYPHQRDGGTLTGRFRLSWCHGAPGIALARALASRLDADLAEHHAGLAQAAVETTVAAFTASIQQPGQDATLCHGISGLSEILLVVSEVLGTHEDRALAERWLSDWVPRLGNCRDCPSGLISKGRTPCLMVGSSGIGLHLLRLGSPRKIPSPLLPGWC
jgi:class II lanthipeptide synthase